MTRRKPWTPEQKARARRYEEIRRMSDAEQDALEDLDEQLLVGQIRSRRRRAQLWRMNNHLPGGRLPE